MIFSSTICSNISTCYNKIGEKDKAAEFIKKSVKLNPKYDKGWYRKAEIEKESGEWENAMQSFKTAQGLNPAFNL